MPAFGLWVVSCRPSAWAYRVRVESLGSRVVAFEVADGALADAHAAGDGGLRYAAGLADVGELPDEGARIRPAHDEPAMWGVMMAAMIRAAYHHGSVPIAA